MPIRNETPCPTNTSFLVELRGGNIVSFDSNLCNFPSIGWQPIVHFDSRRLYKREHVMWCEPSAFPMDSLARGEKSGSSFFLARKH